MEIIKDHYYLMRNADKEKDVSISVFSTVKVLSITQDNKFVEISFVNSKTKEEEPLFIRYSDAEVVFESDITDSYAKNFSEKKKTQIVHC